MDWYELLDFIQTISLVVILLAVSVALYRSRRSSIVVATLVISAAYFIHFLFDIFMGWFFVSEFYAGTVGEIARRGWYLFYALSDFAVVFLIYKILKGMRLKPDRNCTIVAFCYLMLGFAQLVAYADLFILKSNIFVTTYEFIIPLINTFVLIIVSSALLSDKKEKEFA